MRSRELDSMILMGLFQLEILYDLMTVIGPLPNFPHYTAPILSSVLPAEHWQRWEKALCAARDQKCLSSGCSLLPMMLLPHKVYFAVMGKNQKCHSQRPDSGRCWASPVWSIYGLLLGLCALHCLLAFCSPLPALAVPVVTNTAVLPMPSSFPCLVPPSCAAIMCTKEGDSKTSTARNHIILLQPCQETDCRSSCI